MSVRGGRTCQSWTLHSGYASCPDPAVNAQAMEEAAVGCLRKVVADSKIPSREKIQGFFERSWEVLFPAERIRIFRSVLERVDYDGRTEALSLVLSEKGLQGLVRELESAEGA